MTPAESIALAGKMYLAEDDTFTYLATGTPPGSKDGAKNQAETRQEMLRDTAECAVRNFATWWMDLGAVGWFNDPQLWEAMRQLGPLDDAFLNHPTAYRPEVALVIDPESMMRVTPYGTAVTAAGVSGVRASLGRLGAPYGQYLLDDVIAGRVKAKLYVFADAWRLSASTRRQLLAATQGSACLWCYAPGWYDGGQPSLQAMRELTGLTLHPVIETRAMVRPTSVGQQEGISAFGVDREIHPLFAATDATAEETWATFQDGSSAVAIRQSGSRLNVFVGTPGLPTALLREVARRAGVHVYTERDCAVFANGPFLVVHALADGPLSINTGQSAAVRDLLTGQTVGEGPEFSLPVLNGDTRVLQIALSDSLEVSSLPGIERRIDYLDSSHHLPGVGESCCFKLFESGPSL